jgi:hypothetical protein
LHHVRNKNMGFHHRDFTHVLSFTLALVLKQFRT